MKKTPHNPKKREEKEARRNTIEHKIEILKKIIIKANPTKNRLPPLLFSCVLPLPCRTLSHATASRSNIDTIHSRETCLPAYPPTQSIRRYLEGLILQKSAREIESDGWTEEEWHVRHLLTIIRGY